MARRRRSDARPRAGTAGLEQRVLQQFRRLELPDDRPLVVGFSGGPDSLALAAVLARLRPWLERPVLAVHVDHGLRPTSSEEAVGAQALAARLELPCRVIALSAEGLASHGGVGIEEAARRERYLALARAASEAGVAAVAVGHQREDQAETVLLHLIRGSGLTGAAGMSELVVRDVPWWPGGFPPRYRLTIWRPLLDEPRPAIWEYLATSGLEPIADDSNDDRGFRRNAIRHQVLPCLDSVVPGAVSALARFARLVAADDELLEGLATSSLATARVGDGLRVATLRAQSVALQRRIIRRWLAGVAPGVEIDAERTEAVRRLALIDRGGRRVEIGDGQAVRRRRGVLVIDAVENGSQGWPASS